MSGEPAPPRGTVGVGTRVASRPLHGSGQAALPHPALALGHDRKALQRVLMTDTSRREPLRDHAAHKRPRDARGLTPPRERLPPQPAEGMAEPAQRVRVQGHAVVLAVPPNHRAQIRAHLADRVVQALPQLGRNRLQLGLHALSLRVAYHRELPVPRLPTDMREAEEVEGRRFPLLAPLPSLGRKATEFQQPRLVGVEGQAELREPFAQRRQEPLRVLAMLKAQHEVSRPGEFHPQALAEPYLNVSAHTAPIIRPPARRPKRYQWA